MRVDLDGKAIELLQGDITRQEVDAVVNAANSSLLGGGGVDGAIHRAAGPELLAECRTLGGCATGECKITRGYRLKAKYVIHGVGPVYHGGCQGEAPLLASVYRCALQIASERQLKSIAFPAISTGIYGYPMEEAARVALGTILNWLQSNDEPELVRMVLYDRAALETHERVLEELLAA